MKTRPKKEGKKKRTNTTPKGLKLRKTVRGIILSEDTRQVNLVIAKEGKKKIKDIFEVKEAPAKETPKTE